MARDHERLIAPRRLSRMCRKACRPQKTKKPMYMKTAPKTTPATALPSFGSSSPPMTVLLFVLNNAPMVERMTMANMDTTMQVHAFMAETTGFTMLGELCCRGCAAEAGSLSGGAALQARIRECAWRMAGWMDVSGDRRRQQAGRRR